MAPMMVCYRHYLIPISINTLLLLYIYFVGSRWSGERKVDSQLACYVQYSGKNAEVFDSDWNLPLEKMLLECDGSDGRNQTMSSIDTHRIDRRPAGWCKILHTIAAKSHILERKVLLSAKCSCKNALHITCQNGLILDLQYCQCHCDFDLLLPGCFWPFYPKLAKY